MEGRDLPQGGGTRRERPFPSSLTPLAPRFSLVPRYPKTQEAEQLRGQNAASCKCNKPKVQYLLFKLMT